MTTKWGTFQETCHQGKSLPDSPPAVPNEGKATREGQRRASTQPSKAVHHQGTVAKQKGVTAQESARARGPRSSKGRDSPGRNDLHQYQETSPRYEVVEASQTRNLRGGELHPALVSPKRKMCTASPSSRPARSPDGYQRRRRTRKVTYRRLTTSDQHPGSKT